MLRVGKVSYANTMPLFYRWKGFELVEGHPSHLVKLLRKGNIGAGIVSSVEYFFNPDIYWVLPGVSISSRGKVCSVLLLSQKPLREIRRIKITSASLTSKFLLRYLLKEVHCVPFKEVEQKEDAFLSIGDEAMRIRNAYPFVYDLGEEWFRSTSLPFVYALFLVRKEVAKEHVQKLHRQIRSCLSSFFKDLKVKRVPLPNDLDQEYFTSCIDYSLTDEHISSLKLFFSFVERETGKPAPETISLFPL